MKLTINTEFGWDVGLVGFLKSISELSRACDINVTVIDNKEFVLIHKNQLTDEGILYLIHNDLWNTLNEMKDSLDRIQTTCELF